MAARENSRAFPKNTRVKFTSRVFPGGIDNQRTDNSEQSQHKDCFIK